MKIISGILVLFTLSAIAQAQLFAAARGLYQPIILSLGAAYSFIASNNFEEDGFGLTERIKAMCNKDWSFEDSKHVGMKMEKS